MICDNTINRLCEIATDLDRLSVKLRDMEEEYKRQEKLLAEANNLLAETRLFLHEHQGESAGELIDKIKKYQTDQKG